MSKKHRKLLCLLLVVSLFFVFASSANAKTSDTAQTNHMDASTLLPNTVEESAEEVAGDIPALLASSSRAMVAETANLGYVLVNTLEYDSALKEYNRKIYYSFAGINDIRDGLYIHIVKPVGSTNWHTSYCLEPSFSISKNGYSESQVLMADLLAHADRPISLSDTQLNAIGLAILYGQQAVPSEGDLDAAAQYAATQILVWEIALGYRQATMPYTLLNDAYYRRFPDSGENEGCIYYNYMWNSMPFQMYTHGVQNYIDRIVDRMTKHHKTLTLSDIDGNIYTAALTVGNRTNLPLYANNDGTYSATFTDISGLLSEYTFTNTSSVTYSVSGNQLTITAKADVSSIIAPYKSIPTLEKEVFYLWYYQDAQRLLSCVTSPTNDPVPSYFGLELKSATIAVNKTNENGIALAGAEFTATNIATGDKYLIGPTDTNGYAKLDGLPFGIFTVVESKFPTGYQATETTSWTVSLNKNTPNATATINATNKLIVGNLNLIKTTNTGSNLNGWLIGVYTDSACTKPISGSPFTTSLDGTITVQGLLPGTYYCREYANGDPYWSNDTAVKAVTIIGNQTAYVTFVNTHYGNLRVKKNAVNGSSEGWNFQILDSSKNLLHTITTNSGGYATSPMLPPGTYYVCEVHDRDETYWLYDTAVEKQVSVTAGTQTQVSYTNTQFGRIKVVKSLDTNDSLAGWQFKITDVSGNEIPGSPFTTLADGTIITGPILPGQYTIEELFPEGSLVYCKSQNPQIVTVTAGSTLDATFINSLRPGKISIQKVDTYGQPLTGAKFILEWSEDGINWTAITQSNNATVIKGCSTNDAIQTSPENGFLEWNNLYPGIFYRITEQKAPEGYCLLADAAFEGHLPVDDLTLTLRVVNSQAFILPHTGSYAPILFPLIITLCFVVCAGSLAVLCKKEQ